VSRSALALCLLASCAPGQSVSTAFSTQTSRIGPDDGADRCRAYVVALDSTGNFFGADILKGAAAGALGGGLIGGLASGNWKGALIGAGVGAATGAAVGYWSALQQQRYDQAALYTRVQGDISADNAQITRTQYAFDRLMACRFQQAAGINAAYQAHQIDRPTAVGQMASVRALAQRDIQLARTIDGQIEQRGQQFVVAADNIAPGTSGEIAAASAGPATYAAVVVRPTALRLSPNDTAPNVATLPARAKVTVTRKRGSYALVQADTGETGYADSADLKTPGSSRKHGSRGIAAGSGATSQPAGTEPESAESAAAAGPATPQEVATLAGSNAARRDDFAQSVAVSDKAVASGFEVAG
jgi:hypothetical protein